MKISVIGTGYVGLVSGVCLADTGHTVVCVDVDAAKVDMINAGKPPIYEKGLAELLTRHCGDRLSATTDLDAAVADTELSLIAVGTPFDGEAIDLSYIRAAAEQIGTALKAKPDYHVVVVKSTVVPGTSEEVVAPLVAKAAGRRLGPDFGIGMNPEFLREGEAVADFMMPDRIVLGANDDRCLERMRALYAGFPDTDVVATTPKTAEMIKYTANSLLATMISFSNEIGNLCARIGGVDVVEVMRGVHLDKRLTPILDDHQRIVPAFTTYIEAGCGFGGSCFPKDVKALISYGEAKGQAMDLLRSVIAVNRLQPEQMLSLLHKHYPDVKDLRIAVLGLAFKPGTDDMRESPAIPVVNTLAAAGARISAYDPIARHEAERIFDHGNLHYAENLDTCVHDAEAILLITRWDLFNELPRLMADRQPQPLVVDGRRMLDKTKFERYEGIGS
ncbi:MAG: UDP-glucose/GDP-mannose dehydrogenase family protein [Desulfosarcinaceae bacterium]|nr:UDP-glucose/GDP-mannose dehydrogenase family protein [Desulfosarcinaceae bacterium]